MWREEVFDVPTVQARGSIFVSEAGLRCGFCCSKNFWWVCLRQMALLKCWEDEYCVSERLGISMNAKHRVLGFGDYGCDLLEGKWHTENHGKMKMV